MSRCNCFSLQLVGGRLGGRRSEPQGEVCREPENARSGGSGSKPPICLFQVAEICQSNLMKARLGRGEGGKGLNKRLMRVICYCFPKTLQCLT